MPQEEGMACLDLTSTTPDLTSTTPEAVSDADLVRQAQAVPAHFAHLYERYRRPVLIYCTARLPDRAEAEDAASAIFIKALHALPRYTERGDAFRSWLFAIAHNEITDRQRRLHRAALSLDYAANIRDPARTPEEVVMATGDHEQLHTLLADLPARERSVLEQRAAGCQTHEIARVLQISEMSVRAAQSRGLRRLRDRLLSTPALRQEVSHVQAAG
jgi:RNA polymerase sigma-70 factor (ECF subfamily)